MKRALGVALLASMLLLGCDAQATEHYSGEPLLRVRGRVELLQAREEGAELVPALAFRGGDGNFRLIEVDARGAFPAEFVMDVLEPPPAASLQHVDDASDEPRIAVGYITAVSEGLPRVFRYADVDRPSSGEWVDAGTPPEPELEPEQPIWASFAGLSQNYIVVYLEASAAAGSYLARLLGDSKREVPAGYHLIGLREETPEEDDEKDRCNESAFETALAQLNAEHGTEFVEEDFEHACQPEEMLCAGNFELELFERETQARNELGCREGENVLTRITHPEDERITVKIGPAVTPL